MNTGARIPAKRPINNIINRNALHFGGKKMGNYIPGYLFFMKPVLE